MGLISWLKSTFGINSVPLSGDGWSDLIDDYVADICIREAAFWSAVNLISNAISKCEFKTFINSKETKGREYYLWNIEPNKNQSSSVFIHKWISKLLSENEALIIEQNNQLLVADSYDKQPYALYDDIFTNVTVGDFTFNRSFNQSEVLYFKLSECNMRKVTNAMFDSYSKLISHAMKSYQRSRGTKGVFSYESLPPAGSEERKIFDTLINERFKKFMESANAIMPLGKGQSYTDIGSKTYASESTRDIRAMIDDISDFTAKGFNIPPVLLRGDVQGMSDAIDLWLTTCIDPLVDLLQEEIIRKRIGYQEYAKGTYIQIDTKCIKHIDLLSVATSIDKLIGSGAFSINDIRKVCSEVPINEEWANKHFITKNYSSVADLLSLEGG